MPTGETAIHEPLPEALRPLFWDHDFAALDWRRHRDFVTGRVLASGTWENVRWLRATLGDDGLRDWLRRRRGRGLDPRQLRFWQLILHLPRETVDAWVAERRDDPWQRRHGG